jgi:5-methylcytosine-specific restriction enzyme subunit McrC
MTSFNKEITVKEYDYLVSENSRISKSNAKVITQNAFDELTNFIDLSFDTDELDHKSIFWQRGASLQVRHYVGIVQTSDGTLIEILPKITDANDESNIRKNLLKMLREVGELPYKICLFWKFL